MSSNCLIQPEKKRKLEEQEDTFSNCHVREAGQVKTALFPPPYLPPPPPPTSHEHQFYGVTSVLPGILNMFAMA